MHKLMLLGATVVAVLGTTGASAAPFQHTNHAAPHALKSTAWGSVRNANWTK